jgi:hypothetical protein
MGCDYDMGLLLASAGLLLGICFLDNVLSSIGLRVRVAQFSARTYRL